MTNKMTIPEILNEVDASKLHRAEQYLNSTKVQSIISFGDDIDFEFEAFIAETPQKILMPSLSVSNSGEVADIHCQCRENNSLCIHEIALLIAAQSMIEANCSDYHMARKLQAAQVLKNIFCKNDLPEC